MKTSQDWWIKNASCELIVTGSPDNETNKSMIVHDANALEASCGKLKIKHFSFKKLVSLNFT